VSTDEAAWMVGCRDFCKRGEGEDQDGSWYVVRGSVINVGPGFRLRRRAGCGAVGDWARAQPMFAPLLIEYSPQAPGDGMRALIARCAKMLDYDIVAQPAAPETAAPHPQRVAPRHTAAIIYR